MTPANGCPNHRAPVSPTLTVVRWRRIVDVSQGQGILIHGGGETSPQPSSSPKLSLIFFAFFFALALAWGVESS